MCWANRSHLTIDTGVETPCGNGAWATRDWERAQFTQGRRGEGTKPEIFRDRQQSAWPEKASRSNDLHLFPMWTLAWDPQQGKLRQNLSPCGDGHGLGRAVVASIHGKAMVWPSSWSRSVLWEGLLDIMLSLYEMLHQKFGNLKIGERKFWGNYFFK